MNHSNITGKQQATNNKLVNESERNDTVLSTPAHYSTFDKSFQHATTFNAGKCVPILCQEVYPGDMYKIDTESLIRLSAPASTPMMDLNYDVNYFFVPYDQIDPMFKQVMGENDNYGTYASHNEAMPGFPLIVGPSSQFDIATVNTSVQVPGISSLDEEIEDHAIANQNSGHPTFHYEEDDLASYLGVPMNRTMCGMVGNKVAGVNAYFYQPLNLYPFLAYGKIWNDWYRDQNVQGSIDITSCFSTDRSITYPTEQNILNWKTDPLSYEKSIISGVGLAPASKLPDIFTSCLPYQQKGAPLPIADMSNIGLDLETTIPSLSVKNTDPSRISGLANGIPMSDVANKGFFIPNWYVSDNQTGSSTANRVWNVTRGTTGFKSDYSAAGFENNGNMNIQVSPRSDKIPGGPASGSGVGDTWYGNARYFTSTDSNANNARVAWLNLSTKPVRLSTSDDTVQAELTGNALFNITDLRNAIVYQHLLENWALCGSRYVEQLKSIWGISIDPKAIRRSELIGGTNQSLKWNIVQQTSNTTSNSPLGSMASNLYNSLSNPTINYAAEQHGLIMAILTVRSKINYGGQGLPIMFDKKKGLDLWNPLFNGISEQPFKAKYLSYGPRWQPENTNSVHYTNSLEKTFGWQEPFIDTKMNVDTASGFMSLNSSTSLFSLFLFGQSLDINVTPATYVNNKVINDKFMVYDPALIGNTLYQYQGSGSTTTTQFYHQFIALFTHKIHYSTKQPLYNSPKVHGI